MANHNPLNGHAIDNYINKIVDVLDANPADANDLLAQLQTFDQSHQNARLRQAFSLIGQVKRLNSFNSGMVDAALGLIG